MNTSNISTDQNTSVKYNENLILFILAAVQFTHIMDLVIMMPMNPILQDVLHIDNKQFGLLVSSYAASAGIFGFITFFFIDRFDRRNSLLFLYAGFTIGTLGCAVAQNYHFFLLARIASGAFGGILGSLVLAIVGDVFAEAKRGRATGIVMAAFSVASILGIPLGLELAVKVDWHFPFYLVVGVCVLVIIIALKYFPSIKGHMENNRSARPIEMLSSIFSNTNLRWSLLFTCVLMMSGFAVTPYLSDYYTSNLGFRDEDLKYVYMLGGSVSVISGPLIGRLADKFGKRKVFIIVALLSIIPILTITNLPLVEKWIVFVVSSLFFILFGGRFGPALAISTSSVAKKERGRFMSINGSLNQLAIAIAAIVGGVLIGEKVNGHIVTFWMIGVFSTIMTLLCILISFKVKQAE